jgi:Protein of unknown function (DUF2934)
MNSPLTLTDEAVSSLAYRFWEEEGRPEGRAHAHWLRAVAELQIPTVSPKAQAFATSKPAKKSKKLK